MCYNGGMIIFTTGVREQDIGTVGIIVEPTQRGDFIANSAFPVSLAIKITYNNMVEIGGVDAEIIATGKITEALENGARMMKMAFGPTPEQLETIKRQVCKIAG